MKGKTLKVLTLCGISLTLAIAATACGGKEPEQKDDSIVLYSFEQGILPVGMNGNFGSLDVNENADYVKNGVRSLILRPASDGASDPLMYFPFASDVLGINYTNGDKITEVKFWCYAPKEMTVNAGLYFSSFAGKRSFATPIELKEGWQQAVYTLDHETLAVVNNMKNVQGFYLSFPKDEVPASEGVTLYIDDLSVKTVKEELVYTPKIPELVKETGDIITFQNVNFSVVEQESAGVSDWYEEFEGAKGVLQIEANTGWPWYRNRTFWKPAFEKATYADYQYIAIRAYATGNAQAWYQLEDRSVETGGIIEYQMDFTADNVGRWVDFVYPIEKFNTYFDRFGTEGQFMTYADSKTKVYIDSIRAFNEIEGDYAPETTDYKTGEKVDLRVSLGEGYEGATFTYSVNGIAVADPSEYVFEKAGIYTVSIEGVLDGKLVRGSYDITVEIFGEEIETDGKSVMAGGTVDLVPSALKEGELANLTFTFTVNGKLVSDPDEYTVALSPGDYEVTFEARRQDGYLYYGSYTLTVLVYGEEIVVEDTSAGSGETVSLVPKGLFEKYPDIRFTFIVNGKTVSDPTQYTLSTASGRYVVSFEGRRASDNYLYYGSYILSVGNKDEIWADVLTFDSETTSKYDIWGGPIADGEFEWLENYDGAQGVLKMHVGVWKNYWNTQEWKPIFGGSVYQNYTHLAFRVKIEGFEGQNVQLYFKNIDNNATQYEIIFTDNTDGWTTVYMPIDNFRNDLAGFTSKCAFVFLNNPESNEVQTYFYIDSIHAVNYTGVTYEKEIAGAQTEDEIDLTVAELATDYAGVEFTYFVNGAKVNNPSAYVFETAGKYTVTYEGVSGGKLVTGSYELSVARHGTRIEVPDATAQTGRPFDLVPQILKDTYSTVSFAFKVDGVEVENPSAYTAPAEVGEYEVTFEGTDASGNLYYGGYTLNVEIYGEEVTIADIAAGAGETVDLTQNTLSSANYAGVTFTFKADGVAVDDIRNYTASLGRHEITFEGRRESDGYLYYGSYLISVGNKDGVWADIMTFETVASKPNGGWTANASWLNTYEGANGVLKLRVGNWQDYSNVANWKPVFGKSVYDSYTHIAFRVKVEGFVGKEFTFYYRAVGAKKEYELKFTANTNGWTTIYCPIATFVNNIEGFAENMDFLFYNDPGSDDTQTYFYIDSIRAVNYVEAAEKPAVLEAQVGDKANLVPAEYANAGFTYFVNGVKVDDPSEHVFDATGEYTVTYEGISENKFISGHYVFTVKIKGIEITVEDKTAKPGETVNLVPNALNEYSDIDFTFTVNGKEISAPSAYIFAEEGNYVIRFEGASNEKTVFGEYEISTYATGRFMLINNSAVNTATGSEYLSEYGGVKNVVKVGGASGWQQIINNAQFAFDKSYYGTYNTLTLKVWTDTAQTFVFSGNQFDGFATTKTLGTIDSKHLNQWVTLFIRDNVVITKLLASGNERVFDFYDAKDTVYIADFILINSEEIQTEGKTVTSGQTINLVPEELNDAQYADIEFAFTVNGEKVETPENFLADLVAGGYPVMFEGTATNGCLYYGSYTLTVKVDGIEVTIDDLMVAAPGAANFNLVPEKLTTDYPAISFTFTVNETEVSDPSAYTAPAASGRYAVAFTGTAANGGIVYGSYTLFVGNKNEVAADIMMFDTSATVPNSGDVSEAEWLASHEGANGVLKLHVGVWKGYQNITEWKPLFGKSVYDTYTHIAFRVKVEGFEGTNFQFWYQVVSGAQYELTFTANTNGWATVYMPIDILKNNLDGFVNNTRLLFCNTPESNNTQTYFYLDSIRAVNYENVEYAPANLTAEVEASFNLVPEELATTHEGIEFSYFVNGVKAENPAAYVIADEGSYTVTYEGASANKLISGSYTVKAYVAGRFILINNATVQTDTGSEYISEYDGVKNVVKVGGTGGTWQQTIKQAQFAFDGSAYADYDTLTLKVWTDTAQTFQFSGAQFDGFTTLKTLGSVDGEHLNQWVTLTIHDRGVIDKLLASSSDWRSFDFNGAQGNVYIADFILTKSAES